MHQIFSRNVAKIVECLKGKFGYQSGELLRAFDRLHIIHYQELTAPADWSGGRPQPLARFVARRE